jgi:NADH-quinone oxidoreductase subunit H
MTWWLHLIEVMAILIVLLTTPVALIWVERRVLALFQDRRGPNRTGPLGLLQPVADAVKLFAKEDWVPPFADRYLFILSPAIIVVTVLLAFGVVPFTPNIRVSDLNVGLLFFLAMLGLGVYSVVLAGWSSNSKYPLVGGMRAAAQMISYEVPLGLSLVGVIMLSGSFRLGDIIEAQRHVWFCVLQPLGMLVFFVAAVAESRRIPFDLPEADSELVHGYHTEYSGMKFGLFYLGEYLDVTLVACMTTVLFLGGGGGPALPPILWFVLKVGVFIMVFIWVRSILPRFRFDQLMEMGWKLLLPLALLNALGTGLVALLVA